MRTAILASLVLTTALGVGSALAQGAANPAQYYDDVNRGSATMQPLGGLDPTRIDVFKISMADYVNQGDLSNVDMKGRMGAYVDALSLKLASLAAECRVALGNARQLVQAFDRTHSSFMVYAEDQAKLSEEAVWWNLQSGVRDDGTARGYEHLDALSKLYWAQIVSYRNFLITRKAPSIAKGNVIVQSVRGSDLGGAAADGGR